MPNPDKKQGNSVISAENTADRGSSRAIPCGNSQAATGSSIDVVREGNVVREIHVQCSCGEHMKVICTYE